MMFLEAGYFELLPGEIFRSLKFPLLVTAVCLLAVGPLAAQNRNLGEIRGTVTDPSGAVVPGVAVTLTNTQTGVIYHANANSAGVYDAPELTPGNYTITFTKAGFKKLVRSGIDLYVEAITVNAQLEVGATTQQVTVHANVSAVQTESAVQSLRMNSKDVLALPNIGIGYPLVGTQTSWVSFAALVPGVNGGRNQALGGEGLAFNGSTTFEGALLTDGGNIASPGGNTFDILQPTLDSVAEVNFSTSNFGAEYGNGTSVINVITKSGTNHWHGSLYEYNANDAFGTRAFDQPNRTPVRNNQYGGTVGGPIKRDKAFFFFGYQRVQSLAYASGFADFPTAQMRQGIFPTAQGFPAIYDPNGGAIRTPFTNNTIPQDRIDPVAAKIQSYYPMPNCGPGLKYNLGPCAAGTGNNTPDFYWQQPTQNPYTTWEAKLDWNLALSNRLEGSFNIVRSTNYNASADYPLDVYNQVKNAYSVQISDVWNVRPSMVNEFRVTAMREYVNLAQPGAGLGWNQQGSSNYLGLKNMTADAFPYIYTSGLLGTGPLGDSIGAGISFTDAGDTFVIPSDVLTWIKGKHIVKFGGEYDRTRINSTWQTVASGTFNFTGVFTNNPQTGTGGLGYADFLLGLPSNWGVGWQGSIGPESASRGWTPQLFVNDDYKVRPNLTLNIGLRYMMQPGWYDAFNRLANFSPTLNNPGVNPLGVANTPGAICYAGTTCSTTLGVTTKNFFMPRLGFAWSPGTNWVIRGGIGSYNNVYDQGQYGNNALGRPSDTTFGSMTTPDNITPIFTMAQGPPTSQIHFAGNLAANTPNALNGQGIAYTPNNPVGYLWQWRLDVQHQLKGGVLMDAAYVANHGVFLPFGRDMNVVPEALMSEAVLPGMNYQNLRPWPNYTSIYANFMDGMSSYNSLQLSVRKQFTSSLYLVANYTYSHTLDTGSGSGDTGAGQLEVYQNPYNVFANYGNSLLDMRHVFNGSVVYQLPVGQGRRFLNRGGVLNGFVGGWQVASIFQLHTGIPFTPTMSGANLSGTFLSCNAWDGSCWWPNRIGSGELANPTPNLWFNPSAFTPPKPGTFGDSGRNILFGPGYTDVDFSLSKSFPIHKLGEAGKLEIRADAADIANHINWGMPNSSLLVNGSGSICTTCGTGIISGPAGASNRVVQLVGRITF